MFKRVSIFKIKRERNLLIMATLLKKQKSEEEKLITESFRQSAIYNMLILLLTITLSVLVLESGPGKLPKKSDADICYFDKYSDVVRCSWSYSIEKSDIDNFDYELEQNELVLMFFDDQGDLMQAIPNKTFSQMVSNSFSKSSSIIAGLIFIAVLLMFCVIFSVGKDYYIFRRKMFWKAKQILLESQYGLEEKKMVK